MWVPLFLPPSFSSSFYLYSIILLKLFSLLHFLFLFFYLTTLSLSVFCLHLYLPNSSVTLSAITGYCWPQKPRSQLGTTSTGIPMQQCHLLFSGKKNALAFIFVGNHSLFKYRKLQWRCLHECTNTTCKNDLEKVSCGEHRELRCLF